MSMSMSYMLLKQKFSGEFQCNAVRFEEPQVVICRPWIEVSGRSLVWGLLKGQAWPNHKPEVDLRRCGCHLVKWIGRHNFVGEHRIWAKFGRLMQNHMPTAVQRSIWKPEVEFQYGERLILGIGGSNILAVD